MHSSPILTAPALPDRPVIRIVHPSGSLARHLGPLEAGLSRLEAAGCEVRWDERRAHALWRDYFAGSDETRASELISAITEPGVDLVWFARGGSGVGRIAQAVVKGIADAPPRSIIGFSDATALLNLITTRLGWLTWHGPVVTSLGHPAIDTDVHETLETLRGKRTHVSFDPGMGAPIEGRLLGGNLTVLASVAGTPIAPVPWPGTIWLMEDIGEPTYRIDRVFWQLQNSAMLDDAAALWIGDLGLDTEGCHVAIEALRDDAHCPLLCSAPAGHRGRLRALPLGGRGVLNPTLGRFDALEPWVGSRT